jgi:4-hydroxy 2-oxovalerate aldolase
MVAALERAGHQSNATLTAMMDVAEDVLRPLMPGDPVIDRGALALGYAGVYSSFLLHAQRAAEKYGVPAQAVLLELGRRQIVGGQEDMIIDVAAEMARTA